ncbi:MAG: class I SAM-dependent methyltransferase [Bacteroidota bacterium]
MIESNVICPSCKKNSMEVRYQTYWMCIGCGEKYPCVDGIPKLYIENSLGRADKAHRDKVYKYMAWFYNFWNPFTMFPAMPFKIAFKYWIVYFILVLSAIFLIYNLIDWIALRGIDQTTVYDILLFIVLIIFIYFLAKQPRYFFLLLTALPVKFINSFRKFVPKKTHSAIHDEFFKEYLESNKKIKVLDIASGTGKALFKHGYMDLNADYTAVDLAEGMIVQGRDLMGKLKAPADFIIADATDLPFQSNTFDISINYGAVNHFSDPESALREMSRVTKKGGKILFKDEQEYKSSTWIEHIYFKYAFAYHNTIVGCPVHLLPSELEDVQVHQVYRYAYICTARKKK